MSSALPRERSSQKLHSILLLCYLTIIVQAQSITTLTSCGGSTCNVPPTGINCSTMNIMPVPLDNTCFSALYGGGGVRGVPGTAGNTATLMWYMNPVCDGNVAYTNTDLPLEGNATSGCQITLFGGSIFGYSTPSTPSTSPSPSSSLIISPSPSQSPSPSPSPTVSPSASPSPPPSSAGTPAWSQEGFDGSRAGASPYLAPRQSGAVTWSSEAVAGFVISNTVVDADGTLYVATEDTLYSVDPATGYATPLHVIDSATGITDLSLSGAVSVIYACIANQLNAILLPEGTVLWSSPLLQNCKYVASNGTVYYLPDTQALVAADGYTGAILWQHSGAFTRSDANGLALGPTQIFLGSPTLGAVAHNLVNGMQLWVASDFPILSPFPSYWNDALYFVCSPHAVCSLNASTGALLWQREFTTDFFITNTPPAVAVSPVGGGTVLVTTVPGDRSVEYLNGLRSVDGAVLWSVPCGTGNSEAPTVDAAGVALISDGYNVFAVDSLTGALLWTAQNGGSNGAMATVTIGLNKTLFTTLGSKLVAIDAHSPPPAPLSAANIGLICGAVGGLVGAGIVAWLYIRRQQHAKTTLAAASAAELSGRQPLLSASDIISAAVIAKPPGQLLFSANDDGSTAAGTEPPSFSCKA